MVLFTMITRLRDYMPLAASMQNDEEVRNRNCKLFIPASSNDSSGKTEY
jgi:hypothetical protein